jgi:hypothetical protein
MTPPSSVNVTTLPIVVSASTRDYTLGDTISYGDTNAYRMEVTFADVVSISGACNLHFVRGDGQTTDVPGVVVGNKISYTLAAALYALSGLTCWVQFINGETIFTPLKISFAGIRSIPTGDPIVDLDPYPDWLTAIADANDAADRANEAAQTLEDLLAGGGLGEGTPPQVMTQMTGLTIDGTWRDWTPTGIVLADQTVYQLWLRVTVGADFIIATGQFIWSAASPTVAWSNEIVLHMLPVFASAQKPVFVRVMSPGGSAFKLQIASTDTMTDPVVDAKFKALL